MKLSNEMTVNAPVDEAWTLLTDLRRIAPSMPGAVLEKVEGDEYFGTVSVKVGPISVKYRGTARFVELDGHARRAVISARGVDSSGQGSVQALITALLTDSGSATRVLVDTDLAISGRLAQFGRGALADVSTRLMTQFVRNLDETLPTSSAPTDRDAGSSAWDAAESTHPELGKSSMSFVRGVDEVGSNHLAVAGRVFLKQAMPILAGIVVGALAMRWHNRANHVSVASAGTG